MLNCDLNHEFKIGIQIRYVKIMCILYEAERVIIYILMAERASRKSRIAEHESNKLLSFPKS